MTESYMQKRYRTDVKFREKQKKEANQYYKNNKERINKTNNELYVHRTTEQIKDRKIYLKKRNKKH